MDIIFGDSGFQDILNHWYIFNSNFGQFLQFEKVNTIRRNNIGSGTSLIWKQIANCLFTFSLFADSRFRRDSAKKILVIDSMMTSASQAKTLIALALSLSHSLFLYISDNICSQFWHWLDINIIFVSIKLTKNYVMT